jgi:hypothetical protein
MSRRSEVVGRGPCWDNDLRMRFRLWCSLLYCGAAVLTRRCLGARWDALLRGRLLLQGRALLLVVLYGRTRCLLLWSGAVLLKRL